MTHATTTRADSSDRSMAERLRLRVHAIQTGRLRGNEAFLRNRGWSALLRRRVIFEFRAFVSTSSSVPTGTSRSTRG
jgi:hypothetical protein